MRKTEYKDTYFQFPLFLLRDLMTDKNKSLNNIIRYGLYSFAQKINSNLNEVIRQLMYCYYRKENDLPNDLINLIDSYVDKKLIDLDECYCGFNGTEFNPEEEIKQIQLIFETDSNFMNKAINFYLIRQSYSFIGINGNYQNCIKVGEQIQNSISKGEPMVMINKSQLFKFRDEEKTEFELMQFALNIGIRSIIGEKDFVKTNKQMILCRAFGYISNKHLPKTMPDIYWKYNIRYQYEKVKTELEIGNWNLIFVSNRTHGIYVGFKNKITYDKLSEITEMRKRKNKVEDLKAVKKAAQEKAIKKVQQQRAQQQYNNSATIEQHLK